jgi:hypothetical protein
LLTVPREELPGQPESEPAPESPRAKLLGQQVAPIEGEADRHSCYHAGAYDVSILGGDRCGEIGDRRRPSRVGSERNEFAVQGLETDPREVRELVTQVATCFPLDLGRCDGPVLTRAKQHPDGSVRATRDRRSGGQPDGCIEEYTSWGNYSNSHFSRDG